MAMPISFALGFLITLFSLVSATPLPAEVQHPTAFFIFGDGIVDAGNSNYAKTTKEIGHTVFNVTPYGETFFHHPTGRPTDGRLITDFIAENANLPLIEPFLNPKISDYTKGVNFALVGTGVLPDKDPNTLSLGVQVQNFKNVSDQLTHKLGAEEAKKLLKKAVYLISSGGNDYLRFYTASENHQPLEPKNFLNLVLGNLTNAIREIYSKGGRKFGLLNVEPLGCIPAIRFRSPNNTMPCIPELEKLARMHNSALPPLLHKLQGQMCGLKFSLFDCYAEVLSRVRNPTRFGFKDGMNACCGSGLYRGNLTCGVLSENGKKMYELCSHPGEYVWFNAVHFTEHTNNHLASLMWSSPNHSVVTPHNLKALFEMP